MNDLERITKPSTEQARITRDDPLSPAASDSTFAEQFRKIRAEIYRMPGIRTVLVTSATQGEGKTLVAANIAVMISRDMNKKSLLLEADLRNPVLCRYFGISNGTGLTDYLAGSAGLSDVILTIGKERLTIIPGGKPLPNSGELISSKKMSDLVRELKTAYPDRIIIIDSPPLLETSDPLLLSSLVDGIIIVIRSGVTSRETVKQAIGPLPQDKIIGTVLNGLKFSSGSMRKRYFGSHGYYGKKAND